MSRYVPSHACHDCRAGKHCTGHAGCGCDCRDVAAYSDRLDYRLEAEHGAEVVAVARRYRPARRRYRRAR